MNWFVRVLFLVLLCFKAGGGFCVGDWVLVNGEGVPRNRTTSVTLEYRGSQDSGTQKFLWVASSLPGSVLAPDKVLVKDNRVSFPVFARNYAKDLLVFDPNSDRVTTVSLPETGANGVSARLELQSLEGVPAMQANQDVTATLTLQGRGRTLPACAHIGAYDTRGRMVAGRFYDTMDLMAQRGSFRIPAAGKYRVELKLIKEPVSEMPRTRQRDSMMIPFGELPGARDRQETTDPLARIVNVMGTRMPLELLPTTATVVAEDQVEVVCLSDISNVGKRNNWPFVIDSTNVEPLRTESGTDVLERCIKLHRMLGSTFARIRVDWRDVQTGPASFNWVKLHALLNRYRAEQVRPLLEIKGRSAWNGERPTDSEGTMTAWGNFFRELGKKYRPLIWGVYYGGEDIAEPGEHGWADRLKKLISGSADGFFRNADGGYISGPALVLDVGRNFRRLSDSGLVYGFSERALQGISLDLRQTQEGPMSPEEMDLENRIAEVRNQLISAGMQGKIQLYVNGVGWATGPAACSEGEQANYLVRSFVYALKHGAYKVCWYSLYDAAGVPWEGEAGLRSGLFSWNLTPKESAAAYNMCTFLLSGAVYKGEIPQGQAKCFEFDIPVQTNKWPGTMYVAWTEAPGKFQDVLLDMKHGGGVYAVDGSGAEIPIAGADGKPLASLTGLVKIPVGFEPVFIWDAGKPGN